MRSILRIAVIAYVTYLAVALLVISPALNFLPHRYMQDTYGRELRTGWVLDGLYLRDLYLELVRLKPDEYTFSDLLARDTSVEPLAEALAEDGAQPPGLTIHDVDLHSAAIVVTDRTRETPFTSRWNGPQIRLNDVSEATLEHLTRPLSSDNRLSLSLAANEQTQHTAHGTRHTAHGTRHTAHGTRHTAHGTRHTAHGTMGL